MPTIVLVTRPQPAADELAAILQDRFGARVRVVVSPALTIERDQHPSVDEDEVLLITSSNALWAVDGLRNRAVCVGRATTDRASKAGLRAECVGATVQDLAAALGRGEISGRLHYLRGEQVTRDLRDAARAGGADLRETIVYHQRPVPPNGQARQALDVGGPVIALLMSPTCARNFANGLNGTQRGKCSVLSLSNNIAQQIESKGFKGIDVAREPTLNSLLEKLSERL